MTKAPEFESPLFHGMTDQDLTRSMEAARIIAEGGMTVTFTFSGESARMNIAGTDEAEAALRDKYTAADLSRALILLLATSDDRPAIVEDDRDDPFADFFDTDGADLKSFWRDES